MFKSFFPAPIQFFISFVIWSLTSSFIWILGGKSWAVYIGFPKNYFIEKSSVGVSRFIDLMYIWSYIWYFASVLIFFIFWKIFSHHKWNKWSILGSAFILFNIWLGVQISIAVNEWYGPFWDLVQSILLNKGGDISKLYHGILIFLYIAMLSVTLNVINSFFISHYIFRWRTAMNEYYVLHWKKLRHIEGASQRVQEDTMRFATIMEDLAVKFIKSLMTLIAFTPILIELSKSVPTLPFVGSVPHSLVWASIVWSIFGTLLLMFTGMKLPGLEFNNQRVEASYRKELVYGEDDPNRAKPLTLESLFKEVRYNYFKLYFHYSYFNMVSSWYVQLDIIFNLIILFPSISAGIMTLGLINQIRNVFDEVSTSFQYLVNSWKVIIELLSIKKRLKLFESII